jgi:hypothetical protein
MAQFATWKRYWRISTESSADVASPATKADWHIGGNGGGANGWMDLAISKDTDGLQFHPPLIFPTPAAGNRSMNTADPVAGAYVPELGTLPFFVYPELTDRILRAVMGGVSRSPTAGVAARASIAFGSLATLTTQPSTLEQLKFVIASSSAASSAAINIIQNGITAETITIGTNVGTVDGTYYSQNAYDGSVNAVTFTVTGTVTSGMVTVSGVTKNTNTFTWATTNPTLAIEQGGRIEAGSGNSEYFTGVIVPQCSFSYDRSTPDGLLQGEMTLHGMNRATATATTFQNAPAIYTKPFAGWTGSFTIDGSSNLELAAATVNFNNNNEIFAVSSGNQKASGAIEGEVEVFGELQMLPGDSTRHSDFVNATNRTLVLLFTTPYFITGSTPYTMQFTFTRVFFGDYTRNRRGMVQAATLPFRAVYNSTDSGASKVVVVSRMPV